MEGTDFVDNFLTFKLQKDKLLAAKGGAPFSPLAGEKSAKRSEGGAWRKGFGESQSPQMLNVEQNIYPHPISPVLQCRQFDQPEKNMDWPLAITRNQDALKRIVAAMFAMLRQNQGAFPLYRIAGEAASQSEAVRVSQSDTGNANYNPIFTLPRHLYAAILLILRPAESAVRRLIVIAARGLVLNPRATGQILPNFPAFAATNSARIPSFALLDSLKHFDLEDFDQSANPRLSFSSSYDPNFFAPSIEHPDEPVNAALLFSRMRALRHALSDLPKQARRLARWRARRNELLKARRPTRITPFRPGLPPGWRQRSIHAVDDVLRECHGLAIHAVNGPDTG